MNSRQSSQRDSPKSPTATATLAKADGGGLDSLVQTLDRAARRRRRQQRRHPFADASAVSSRTATPSSRRSCQRRPQQLERRQPQRPCVEHCRFQICEVTCELGSPGLAGTDADDEDEPLLTEGGAEARADGNQSNAVSRRSCRNRTIGSGASATRCSSLSKRQGRRRRRRPQQGSEEALIGSVAESLVALSRDLQLCVHTIRDTVTELQRCSDDSD
ncbi:hypothetical protein BOX15_Mlig011257g1 [Macrostomum lignano]|uniref:Uncharacterized protein n=1 Tax=Macrostomum lignano TaxID=282301 RepID=A0A267FRX3_9PLAT|nr:hypothetical protein BOX15_Mlig011257g1 [Macrostomum lignano]